MKKKTSGGGKKTGSKRTNFGLRSTHRGEMQKPSDSNQNTKGGQKGRGRSKFGKDLDKRCALKRCGGEKVQKQLS